MQHKRLLKTMLLFICLATANVAHSQNIGVNWEFNENNNSEGWEVNRSLSDLTVSDGATSGPGDGP